MDRSAVARALRSLLKDSPTPEAVHVPSAQWTVTRRRRRVAERLRKLAADPGLYVGRELTPACDALLREWWSGLPDKKWFDLDKHLHVTIVHSRDEIPWTLDTFPIRVPARNFVSFKTLGKDRAMVLRFRSQELQLRWKAARSAGATWDHPAYLPHMTLFYDQLTGDSTEYRDGVYPPLPPFDLEFGPEQSGPLAEDIFKWIGAKDFLSAQDCEEMLAEAVHASWMEHQENTGDEHMIAYPDLDGKAKQVDRDAVRAVLNGVAALGYQFTKL